MSDAPKAAELTDEQIEAFARIVDAAEVMGQTFGLTTGMAFRFMAKTARQLARANADGQFNLAAMMTPKGEM